jgi:hypothetical protein
VSTVNKPHDPLGSEPSRDDDPTGVRDLLSSLPQPDPMPEHLIARINASLAAEQTRRTGRMSSPSVSPLLAGGRRRRRRLVFGLAGAAAAMALLAVVGSNVFPAGQSTTSTIGAALLTPSSNQDSGGKAAPRAEADTRSSGQRLSSGAPPSAAAKTPTRVPGEFGGSTLQIARSGTRYTRAGFVAQALALRDAAPQVLQAQDLSAVGPAATDAGMMDCLSAIGAAQAVVVTADVASYEGRTAVVIVATTGGVTMAYVVDPQCSHAHPSVLRQATPLP